MPSYIMSMLEVTIHLIHDRSTVNAKAVTMRDLSTKAPLLAQPEMIKYQEETVGQLIASKLAMEIYKSRATHQNAQSPALQG